MKTFATAASAIIVLLTCEQQATAAERRLVPSASSPTAMVKCGAQLEPVKARLGALQRYVFTGQEVLAQMRYCISESSTDVVDTRNQYRVPKGTVGWLAPDGWVVLEGCVNDALCEGCSIGSAATLLQDTVAAPPAPPTVTAPAQRSVPVTVKVEGCPNGWRLNVYAWEFSLLPASTQERIRAAMRTAAIRKSGNASNPAGYVGDAVSRTVGDELLKLGLEADLGGPRVRARSEVAALIFKRELQRPQVPVQAELGSVRVANGRGSILVSGDPRQWITEIIFPGNLISPMETGGARRLLMFPAEWNECTKAVHGILP